MSVTEHIQRVFNDKPVASFRDFVVDPQELELTWARMLREATVRRLPDGKFEMVVKAAPKAPAAPPISVNDQVRKMRATTDMTLREIGAHFGIRYQKVTDICRRVPVRNTFCSGCLQSKPISEFKGRNIVCQSCRTTRARVNRLRARLSKGAK